MLIFIYHEALSIVSLSITFPYCHQKHGSDYITLPLQYYILNFKKLLWFSVVSRRKPQIHGRHLPSDPDLSNQSSSCLRPHQVVAHIGCTCYIPKACALPSAQNSYYSLNSILILTQNKQFSKGNSEILFFPGINL